MYLVLVVRTGYAHCVPHICCICAEQEIIIFIIPPCNLPGPLATKVCVSSLTYAMRPQHFLRRRIYRIAFSAPDLLSAGSSRGYMGERQMLPWQMNKTLIIRFFLYFQVFQPFLYSANLAYIGITWHSFVSKRCKIRCKNIAFTPRYFTR